MNKIFLFTITGLLLLSACATNQETRFNYKIGEPKILIMEATPENISDYIWVEDFDIITIPVSTSRLHYAAAKSVLKLAEEKNCNLVLLKSGEVISESSILGLLQRQRIKGSLFRKTSSNKP